MVEIVNNKHFSISMNTSATMVTDKRLQVEVTFTPKTTRATKFQMKKALKRKIIQMLWEGIRSHE